MFEHNVLLARIDFKKHSIIQFFGIQSASACQKPPKTKSSEAFQKSSKPNPTNSRVFKQYIITDRPRETSSTVYLTMISVISVWFFEFSFWDFHFYGFAKNNQITKTNAEQLKFYEKQTTLAMPVVLLMHIPLYLIKDAESDDIATCGDPRWGWDMDKNHEIEQRERWSRNGNLPSTVKFLEMVKKPDLACFITAYHY